mmetsp:Transcript_26797/g.43107  ORF Transcript_26797/g.43107 Transcript_26797/m.43107 type:complete len:843 (+) Transcript_26797:175-2703(+)
MFEICATNVAVLVGAVWLAVSVVSYWGFKAQDRERRRRAAAHKPKRFVLETNNEKGTEWKYCVGKGGEFDFVGTGQGRSSWIPSDVDKAPEFPFNRETNANAADRVYRHIMCEKNPASEADMSKVEENASEAEKAATTAIRGSSFYSRLQSEDGFWPGDYGGPMFLLPGMVIACYVTNVELGTGRKSAMLRYIMNHQREEDGGWGTHIEGQSTVFGSSLNYAAARLLGLKRDDPRAVRGREFIKSEGGAIAAPQWAKFWLAVLGAYDWDGVNPTPPELWLLPYWFPFHPGRMWCHCRMVYLPMSALFGSRWVYPQAESDTTILSLREELYVSKYETIPWGSFNTRECVADRDIYNPQTYLMTFANHLLHNTLENPLIRAMFFYPLHYLRERALEFAYDYIHMEDVHTNWVDIGPVSKAFHIVANYARYGENSPNFERSVGRIDDYLWLAEDGLKMQGYNGSQLWDTCFATHALATSVLAAKKKKSVGVVSESDKKKVYDSMLKASKFVDDMQVQEDVELKELYFRDNSKGGWPFSNRDHGWPISDCTAEGVKAAILLSSSTDFQNDPRLHHISQGRLEDAITIILELQNTSTDNGWASYELNRGYNWYEWLNPAQVFGDIMIDYSYVECTSACVQALCEFAKRYPKSRLTKRALTAATLGAEFIISKQRENGGWYGSWAVCFAYAAWFGLEGLATALMHCKLTAKQRKAFEDSMFLGCEFLLKKQREDGGWGEDIKACAVQEWVENENGSQVVQTGWALIALMKAVEYMHDTQKDDPRYTTFLDASTRAAAFLRNRQLQNGDWAQESISGVFNKSCAITYTAYRNVFPIWALGRYATFMLEC